MVQSDPIKLEQKCGEVESRARCPLPRQLIRLEVMQPAWQKTPREWENRGELRGTGIVGPSKHGSSGKKHAFGCLQDPQATCKYNSISSAARAYWPGPGSGPTSGIARDLPGRPKQILREGFGPEKLVLNRNLHSRLYVTRWSSDTNATTQKGSVRQNAAKWL